jgi:hypothetical protein
VNNVTSGATSSLVDRLFKVNHSLALVGTMTVVLPGLIFERIKIPKIMDTNNLAMLYRLNGHSVVTLPNGRLCLFLPIRVPHKNKNLQAACDRLIQLKSADLIRTVEGWLLPVDCIIRDL